MKGIDWAGLVRMGRTQAAGLLAHLPGRTPSQPLPDPLPKPLAGPEAAPRRAPTADDGTKSGPIKSGPIKSGPVGRLTGAALAGPAAIIARAAAPLKARLARQPAPLQAAKSVPAAAAPDRSRRIMRTAAVGVATLSVAFAAGNFVQSGAGAPDRGTAGPPRGAALATSDAGRGAGPGSAVAPTGIVELAAPAEAALAPPPAARALAAPSSAVLARADGPATPDILPAPGGATPVTALAAVAPAPACPVVFDLSARDGGLLDIALSAPCAAGRTVVLRHAGLAVSAALDDAGALALALPALDPAGAVALRFDDGTETAGAARVDLSELRRYAVQWQAPDAFALHAYEGAAAHGDPGHVSAASALAGAPAWPQPSGWMARLGDGLALVAEVYTFPVATGAAPRLSIEAEVTAATCGREILGETLLSIRGVVTVEDLTLVMPGCDDAIGDFLVLNNPLAGTTLASAAN